MIQGLQGTYIFKKVREGRAVLFGTEELMRDCNEIYYILK